MANCDWDTESKYQFHYNNETVKNYLKIMELD